MTIVELKLACEEAEVDYYEISRYVFHRALCMDYPSAVKFLERVKWESTPDENGEVA